MADSGPGSGPGLLRYFKPCRKDSCQISLPNPTGPLSEKVPLLKKPKKRLLLLLRVQAVSVSHI